MIAVYGSRPHYLDHMLPVWRALEGRASIHAPAPLAHQLRRIGVPAAPGSPRRADLVLVASGADARDLRPRRIALIEHGAGQAYDVADGGYSGGPGRENAALFLCPNEVVAGRNRRAYPEARVEMVGSPRVDALRSVAGTSPDVSGEAAAKPPTMERQPSGPPTVAISWHFESPFRMKAPESGTALPHYRSALPAEVARLRAAGFRVIGHGHPRSAVTMRRMWRRMGVEWVADFAEVVRRADIYACDNSSTLYEAAACGIPVVVLNAPWYRRGLDAWPRFWRCADVGVQCDNAAEIFSAVVTALEDPPAARRRRAEVVAEVFPLQDGRAAERCAHALLETASAVVSPR